MRWALFFLACTMQGAGLMLLRRSGWFTGSIQEANRPSHPLATAKTARTGLAIFCCGGLAMLLFALWEHHAVLALGQLAASALCLLGGQLPKSTSPSGITRKTGLS